MSHEDCEAAGHVRYCPDCDPDAFMCTTCEIGARVAFALIAEETRGRTSDLAARLRVSHELTADGLVTRCEFGRSSAPPSDSQWNPGPEAERRALVRLAAAVAQRIEDLDDPDDLVDSEGDRGSQGPRDFYILAATEIVGNCALWWCPDGKGYTCELEKAGLYTWSQASSHRKSDVPIHRDIVDRVRVSHVRVEHLRQNVDGRLVFGPDGGLEPS